MLEGIMFNEKEYIKSNVLIEFFNYVNINPIWKTNTTGEREEAYFFDQIINSSF